MNEAPFRCSTLGLAPGLAHKHYKKLAILVRDKHSSLFRKSVNYEQICNIGRCKGQILQPIRPIRKLQRKWSVMITAPWLAQITLPSEENSINSWLICLQSLSHPTNICCLQSTFLSEVLKSCEWNSIWSKKWDVFCESASLKKLSRRKQ